jgi:dsRNA-specific ribonuclease
MVDGLIERTEMISGHVFKNKLLCAEALQTKPPDCLLRVAGAVHRVDKNQALEFVGDAVMNAVLAKMFYQARDYRGNLALYLPACPNTDNRRQALQPFGLE